MNDFLILFACSSRLVIALVRSVDACRPLRQEEGMFKIRSHSLQTRPILLLAPSVRSAAVFSPIPEVESIFKNRSHLL
jgi:hypothetical protein